MNNLNFVGNTRVIEQLGCLIDSKRFPHALIIEGEHGLGKKTLARRLAGALVCRGDHKPCSVCRQCRKAEQGFHPDIIEHIAQGGSNSFHVDVIRNIVNEAFMSPNEADYKVYILGNAECMNISAQNALLKILEEPPEHVIFIMTVSSKSMLLETVLSRSVVVRLEGVDIKAGAQYIAAHSEGVDIAAAVRQLETFNGNIGKALGSLENSRVSEITDICLDVCSALVSDSEYSLLTACSAFQNDRQSIILAMDFLKNIFRDALVFKPSSDLISGQTETVTMLKNKITRQKLIDLIYICDKLKDMALKNSNNSLLITKICYSLRQAIGR